jgi:hypothetical protein
MSLEVLFFGVVNRHFGLFSVEVFACAQHDVRDLRASDNTARPCHLVCAVPDLPKVPILSAAPTATLHYETHVPPSGTATIH